jgi:hypothetical protein
MDMRRDLSINNGLASTVQSVDHTATIFMTVLSLGGATLVLLSYIVFPQLVKNKTLSFAIMLVSFNNWVTSLGLSLGLSTGTKCTVQGVLTMFGIKGSWFCVVIVCYQLRKTITEGKLTFTSKQVLIMYIIWQIIQMLYIPAIGFAYGIPNIVEGEVICKYKNTRHDYLDYLDIFLGLFLFEYIMAIIIIYNVALISTYVNDLKSKVPKEQYDKVNELKKSAWKYPIFMLVVWAPFSLYVVLFSVASPKFIQKHSFTNVIVAEITILWGFADGFFNFLIYFYTGRGTRDLWSGLLSKYTLGRAYLAFYAYIKGMFICCTGSHIGNSASKSSGSESGGEIISSSRVNARSTGNQLHTNSNSNVRGSTWNDFASDGGGLFDDITAELDADADADLRYTDDFLDDDDLYVVMSGVQKEIEKERLRGLSRTSASASGSGSASTSTSTSTSVSRRTSGADVHDDDLELTNRVSQSVNAAAIK